MKNKESLTPERKDEYKKLLSELSESIKKKEDSSSQKIQVDEKLGELTSKIDSLKTQGQANDFLDDVKKELQVLKVYSKYHELFEKLEKKVEEFEEQFKKTIQQQLGKLQQNIHKTNVELTKEQIVSKAGEGRKKAVNEVSGIVDKLAKKGGFWGKLAQLSNKGKK